jgi:hypothetical protein
MDAATGTSTQDQRLTIVEVVAYAGTAIALVGTGAVVGAFTSGSRGIQLLVAAIVAAVLFAVGWLTGEATHDRLQRLRSVEWFLSINALQAFFQALIQPGGKGSLFLVLLLTAVVAFVLWWLLRRTLQQLAFTGAAFGAVIVLTAPDSIFGFGPPSLTLTAIVTIVLGAVWFVLGWRSIVEPPRTAMVIGSVTALVGTLFVAVDSPELAFLLLALAGGALLVAGNAMADRAVSGIGIVGLLLGSALFFGTLVEGRSGSIVSLLVGIALLAVALVLARSWGHVEMRMPPLGGPTPTSGPPEPPAPSEPPAAGPPAAQPPGAPPDDQPPTRPPWEEGGGFRSG